MAWTLTLDMSPGGACMDALDGRTTNAVAFHQRSARHFAMKCLDLACLGLRQLRTWFLFAAPWPERHATTLVSVMAHRTPTVGPVPAYGGAAVDTSIVVSRPSPAIAQIVVMLCVRCLGNQYKVLKAIVVALVVFVVNGVTGGNRAVGVLPHGAVLQHISAITRDVYVAVLDMFATALPGLMKGAVLLPIGLAPVLTQNRIVLALRTPHVFSVARTAH